METSFSKNKELKAKDCALGDIFELLQIDVDLEPTSANGVDMNCSRNVLRKHRNWEKRLDAKKTKRKEEKQRRKQSQTVEKDTLRLSKRVIKAITRERLAEARLSGPRLCVDLSMADCMSRKELSRLAGQIRRLYGSNRNALRPFHLYLTEFRLDSRLYTECVRMNDGFHEYAMEMTEQSWLHLFPVEDVVYLTPDAEQALENVDDETVYILGGLVDESIQKKMTYSRALEAGVRTARLPIEEHMVRQPNGKNFHSKILAINQVFEILLVYRETGSWGRALPAGVPAGKGYTLAVETGVKRTGRDPSVCHLLDHARPPIVEVLQQPDRGVKVKRSPVVSW
ncbi:tRNA methyltransferase 10 homolog B isoform X2 [Clupea harengus]|uniref:tRNA methyltransferase 10 homolog B n=1 Tax=Clupea harengus TaxID=7950 RepID=A0A6P8H1K4_CLUHA|nr:tRNA methyltransferase 10 homolog B isoform X2 [Clupea harengus]